jgi:hypothetical protein
VEANWKTTTTAAPIRNRNEIAVETKTKPTRERRWCGREGLVHHRLDIYMVKERLDLWRRGWGGRGGARSRVERRKRVLTLSHLMI